MKIQLADSFASRLKKAMNIKNIKQIDIVERTGINKGALSSYISGKYKPKRDNLYLLAQTLGVDEAWLLGYDVPMEPIVVPDEMNIAPELLPLQRLTPHEVSILKLYHSLNDMGKQVAMRRLEELTMIETYAAKGAD